MSQLCYAIYPKNLYTIIIPSSYIFKKKSTKIFQRRKYFIVKTYKVECQTEISEVQLHNIKFPYAFCKHILIMGYQFK